MPSATQPHRHTPLLGCIADDVTGATDLAINLVQGGMRVMQVLGVPDAEAFIHTADFDAIVIALKSRSIPTADAVEQSLASLRSLQQLGVVRYYFKYCSTFDSTVQGNIGPVAEALMEALDVDQTIVCPAFPRAGRTVYRGHLFVGDKLLNESGMEHHPLNPMTDANLVRFLSKQATGPVGLLSCDTLDKSAADCRQRLATLAREHVSLVVADTCHDSHLATLAQAVAESRLLTGGSGLARYLPEAWRTLEILEATPFQPCVPQVHGRSMVLAGSCSTATLAQVNWMRNKCPVWDLDVAAVLADASAELTRLSEWAGSLEQSQTPVVASTAPPNVVAKWQNRYGGNRVAAAVERFLATVATTFVNQLDVRRLVLAGGETSGAICRALGIRSLRIGPEICVGVPWTETIDCQPQLAVALKSGNFGGQDFFSAALEMLP